jgi:hypothetical protein
MMKPPFVALTAKGGATHMILTGTLPAWSKGNVYPSAGLTRVGGAAPFTWSISSGSLPTGLSINSSTGVISGTPTGSGTSFTVQVVDSTSPTPVTATLATSITINADASWSSVSLLLKGEGANNSTTFTDSAATPKTVTGQGSAKISTSQFKWGSSSIALARATSDDLSVAHHTELNLSTSTPDFTLEGWIYLTNAPTDNQSMYNKDGTFGSSYPSYLAGIDTSTRKLNCILGSGNGVSSVQVFSGVTVIPLTTWVHFAMVRKGTKLFGYLNGLLEFNTTITATMVDGGKAVLLGFEAGQPSAQHWNGYMDDMRITKGVCRYDGTGLSIGAAMPGGIPTMPFPIG